MLVPKKIKHRKWHKPTGGNTGVATRLTNVSFGSHGLKSIDYAWISSRQIEATRRVLTRYVRRGGKVWIRIFPDHPITKKGAEVPMGGGKGSPDHYIASVKPGTVMFEIGGIPDDKAKEALKDAAHKLPVKVKVVEKR
jgi:large subunit ribosomal protein L16